MTIGAVLTLVLLPLILAEIAAWSGWLAKRLLPVAAFLHYGRTSRRSVRAEEWSQQLQDIPGSLSQLVYALGHLMAGFASVVVRTASRVWRKKRLDRDALLRALDAGLVRDPDVAWLDPGHPAETSPVLFIPAEETADLAWQSRALCGGTDGDAFFPKKGGSSQAAKRVCARCEVKAECLQYALDHDERFGVWGGLTGKERRRLSGPAA